MVSKFISYKFVDSMGNLRDKIVRVQSRKEATYFDGSSIGFVPTNKSDVLLVPDIDSEHFDPIRNLEGVFCFVCDTSGIPLEKDFRTQASVAMNEDHQTKNALFGVEPEFFICRPAVGTWEPDVPIDLASLSCMPDKQDKWYGSLPPIDTFQDLRFEIAEELEKASFNILSIHHEVAPGQCEFSWECSNLLKTCDQLLFFKYIISNVCHRHNLIADFRAKPFEKLNGSGCHVHQSIPLMKLLSSEGRQEEKNKIVELYAQGLVDHYDELRSVCCVGETSNNRLVPGFEAPTKENNGWGWHDRTKTVRIPGNGERLEFRLPDNSMNAYIAIPMMLKFGYEAVKKGI